MSEGRSRDPDSYRDRKSESPEDGLKSEVGSPNAELENPFAINISHAELNKSDIEHPTSEIKSKSEIVNCESEMEIHHHPEVEKKGFKEYLLEGLMIFIAVMLGFFAESLREHVSENKKAKDYAVTLYSDLKLDTAELDGYLNYFRYATANTDTLLKLLSEADIKQIPSGKLYWFGLFGGAYHIFTPHDATLLEMKNSGSLRFFGDKIINRKLALYDQECQSMKLSEEQGAGIYAETRKARARIFEFKYNEQANDIFHGLRLSSSAGNADPYGMMVASRQAKIDSFKKTNPPLLSYDKTLFNEYIEMVRSRFLYLKVQSADTLKHRATELINLLNKKYDLQDE
jgi:hypothetical protein